LVQDFNQSHEITYTDTELKDYRIVSHT